MDRDQGPHEVGVPGREDVSRVLDSRFEAAIANGADVGVFFMC